MAGMCRKISIRRGAAGGRQAWQHGRPKLPCSALRCGQLQLQATSPPPCPPVPSSWAAAAGPGTGGPRGWCLQYIAVQCSAVECSTVQYNGGMFSVAVGEAPQLRWVWKLQLAGSCDGSKVVAAPAASAGAAAGRRSPHCASKPCLVRCSLGRPMMPAGKVVHSWSKETCREHSQLLCGVYWTSGTIRTHRHSAPGGGWRAGRPPRAGWQRPAHCAGRPGRAVPQ